MSMDKAGLLAFFTLLFMLFIQASTSIWWASGITTTQKAHTEWILNHNMEQKDYPVLKNNVGRNSDDIQTLVNQMNKFLTELRGIKEKQQQ